MTIFTHIMDALSLVERVKKECTIIDVDQIEKGIIFRNIDIDSSDGKLKEIAHFLGACEPNNKYNYRKTYLDYWGLPLKFKRMINDPNFYEKNYKKGYLFVFNYPLKIDRIKKYFNNEKKAANFIAERVKKCNIKEDSPIIVKPSEIEKFMNKFMKLYSDSSCILPYQDCYIIGKKEVNKEIMEYIKEDPINFFMLMKNLEKFPKGKLKEINHVQIYDLLNKPKQVDYDISGIKNKILNLFE